MSGNLQLPYGRSFQFGSIVLILFTLKYYVIIISRLNEIRWALSVGSPNLRMKQARCQAPSHKLDLFKRSKTLEQHSCASNAVDLDETVSEF